MKVLRMVDVDLLNKRVLVRVDFNVPVAEGRVTSDARIRAALPTIQAALDAGAAVILMSHLGRPQEGEPLESQPDVSLAPVATHLGSLLNRDVPLLGNWIDGIDVVPGQVVLLENVRLLAGEAADDPELAQRMARLCDVFVMDAFGTAHRAQCSTHGVALAAPIACAGPLLCAELDALELALADPRRPMVAIVGGSKVSTKLQVLDRLAEICDQLIVGGGIANTFLAAAGHPVGASLHEADMIPLARELLEKVNIPLPQDVIVAREFSADADARTCGIDDVASDEMILDIGPVTSAALGAQLASSGTILWNGPVGVFELAPFADGTRRIADAIAASPGFSLAGGGDTLAAIDQFGVADRISYISTGGGAFLEFVEGKKLPAVAALEQRAAGT